jgi:tetratricopeptide (TPR) repeat protein
MKKCLSYNEKTFTQDSIKDLYIDLKNAIGNFHYRFGNFKKSVSQFKVNYSQAKLDWEGKNSIENLYQYASKSFDLGNNYYLGGKYKKALIYMYESYGLHEKLFLQKKEIYIFENILRIVGAIADCETVPPQGDFDKMLTNVLPVFEDTFKNPDNKDSLFLLARLLANCGKALILLKDYQKSKYLLEKAILFFSIIQDPLNMPESCRLEHGPIGILGIVEIYLGNIQRGNELYLEFKNKAKIRGYHDFIGVLGQYCDAYTDCQVDSMSYMVRVDYLNYFENLYRSDLSPETLEEMIGAKIYLTKATADDPQKTAEILGEVAEDLENLGNSFPNPSLESLKRAFELAKNGWVDTDLPE